MTPGRNEIPIEKLSVLVLYSDQTSGAEVLGALQHVQSALGGLGEPDLLEVHPWRLDMQVDNPNLRELLSQEMSGAGMVVVTLDGTRSRWEAFCDWAEEAWPERWRDRPCALVGFCPAGRSGRGAVAKDIEWLRTLAARKGMDFLSNEAPVEQSRFVPVRLHRSAKEPLAVALAAYPNEAANLSNQFSRVFLRHYGINE